MFKIAKNEPEFFKKAKKKAKLPKTSKSWEDIHQIRRQLRKHILENEQYYICAYCETKLTEDNSNIDHFKTRHKYPEKTLDYNNLLVSCNNNSRCSRYKDEKIKNKNDYINVINPVIENPNDFIYYSTMGVIMAINGNEKAKSTIDIFQLHKLDERRKQIAKALHGINHLSLDKVNSVFDNEFKSFINNIFYKIKHKG